jgi:hypothetical protein
MYICSILKCCILSNNKVTHYIAKIIIDFYKTYCWSCQFDCQMFSFPLLMYKVFVEQILPREKQKWTIFTPLLCKWSCYCFLVFNYWCKSTLYMNDVFWLVDTRGIALPLLSLFPSNTPSQGYLSFGIPHSFYDSIISIYWTMSFMLYSRFYYWGNTCRRNKINGNKATTPSVMVFTYHNSYM